MCVCVRVDMQYMYVYSVCTYKLIITGISIVDADITTDIVEPADFSRFVRDQMHTATSYF